MIFRILTITYGTFIYPAKNVSALHNLLTKDQMFFEIFCHNSKFLNILHILIHYIFLKLPENLLGYYYKLHKRTKTINKLQWNKILRYS